MTDESNILIEQINGPNLVTGAITVITPTRVRAMQSAMLCRCGHSRDKPFCDGAHVKSEFSDSAQLPAKFSMRGHRSGPIDDPTDTEWAEQVRGTANDSRFQWAKGQRGLDLPLSVRRVSDEAVLRRHAQEDWVSWISTAPPCSRTCHCGWRGGSALCTLFEILLPINFHPVPVGRARAEKRSATDEVSPTRHRPWVAREGYE